MSNKYGIPEDDLKKIRARDKTCVYCHKEMIDPSTRGRRSDWATIEHLNFLPPWNNPATVAICCWSCIPVEVIRSCWIGSRSRTV